MSSFTKIAALFIVSSPLALAGCMAEPEDSDLSADPGMQSQDVTAGFHKAAKAAPPAAAVPEQPCLVTPNNPPLYSAPVTPAPTYPAPSYGAPRHEAPVYKAPAYQLPTYQSPGEVPGYGAPNYLAPNYPGPTFMAPVYEAPIYEAPSFPAPIFERATYGQGVIMPPRLLAPCAQPQDVLPIEESIEAAGGGAGGAAGGQSSEELNP